MDYLGPIKEEAGISDELASCHTAKVAGYYVEGHVPAEDLRRLLKERPAVKGIAVPGMPMGSPGMEGSYREHYRSVVWTEQGEMRTFAEH